MPALLSGLLIWVISSAVARVLVALGIGFFTYSGLVALVESLVGQLQPMLSGLPSQVLSLLAIAGVPQALSIVCSAVLTRAAFNAARIAVGLTPQ